MGIIDINKEQAKKQIEEIGKVHLNAKIQMLEELIEEIKTEGYETFSQLERSINSNLDILNEIKTKEAKTNG